VRRALAAIALLVWTGCFEPLSFEAEASNACLAVEGLPVTGMDAVASAEAPAAMALPTTAFRFERSLDFPVDAALSPAGSGSTTILLNSVTLSVESGNLDFVQTGKVSLARSGSTTPVPILTYQRKTNPGQTLLLEPTEPVDVVPYLSEGTLSLAIQLSGTLPASSTTMQVKVCFAAKTSAAYPAN
jgi:hypothetical protein